MVGQVVRHNLRNVEGVPAGGVQQPEHHTQFDAAGLQVLQFGDGADMRYGAGDCLAVIALGHGLRLPRRVERGGKLGAAIPQSRCRSATTRSGLYDIEPLHVGACAGLPDSDEPRAGRATTPGSLLLDSGCLTVPFVQSAGLASGELNALRIPFVQYGAVAPLVYDVIH